MAETSGRDPQPNTITSRWDRLTAWLTKAQAPQLQSVETPRNPEASQPPEVATIPKIYFHTFERHNFRPELGVMSQGRHDNVTDFSSWSLFFPYEKIGNYWGSSPRRAVPFLDSTGRPNFATMILDDSSPVTKVTDRYKRAYVAREPQLLDDQTQAELSEKGIWTGAAQQTIDQSHFIAELPLSRELQHRFTQLKVEVATFQTTQPQLEAKLREFFSTAPPDKQPIFKQPGTDLNQVCRLLANGMMRDFVQRYVPALARLSRHSNHYTAEQKAALWTAVRHTLSSEALVRYVTQVRHQLEQEGVVSPDQTKPHLSPLQARELMVTLNHDESTGQRYLPSPGDVDFHGYYFSSGELTFWAKRTGRDDLLEGRDYNAFAARTIAAYPDLQSLVMMSDAYELKDGQPKSRFLVGIDVGGWSIAQMLDNPPTDTTQFEERTEDKREQTVKYFLSFWNRPAKQEHTNRKTRLFIAGDYARQRTKETLPAVAKDDVTMAHMMFQILTGTKPESSFSSNLVRLAELGIAIELDSYGERLAAMCSGITTGTPLTPADHQRAVQELEQADSPYLTTNVWSAGPQV